MAVVKKGTEIRLDDGRSAGVLDGNPLGSGRLGRIYRVGCNGKEYALKRFTDPYVLGNRTIRDNLADLANMSAPAGRFLWPLHITDTGEDELGYVMDLISEGYVPMSDLLGSYGFDRAAGKHVPVSFGSTYALIDASANLMKVFEDLHRRGLNAHTLDDGNVHFDPRTGDIRIGR